MKTLLLSIALVPGIVLAQSNMDSSLVFDGKGIKVASSKELAPLSYNQTPWMAKLGITKFSFEAVAAMKPDTNEQLWVGMGVGIYLKPWGAVTPSLRAGFTSNILRESFDNTQALWYFGAGIRF